MEPLTLFTGALVVATSVLPPLSVAKKSLSANRACTYGRLLQRQPLPLPKRGVSDFV